MIERLFTRNEVIDIIAASFDAVDIRKEVNNTFGVNLSPFGELTRDILRDALAVRVAFDAIAPPK